MALKHWVRLWSHLSKRRATAIDLRAERQVSASTKSRLFRLISPLHRDFVTQNTHYFLIID